MSERLPPLMYGRYKGGGNKLVAYDTPRHSATIREIQEQIESGRDVKIIEVSNGGDVERDVTTAVLFTILQRMERAEKKLPTSLLIELIRIRAKTDDARR